MIHGVRDILTILHVQHYNTGSVTALDNQCYNSGTADFHVAMAEMLIDRLPRRQHRPHVPGTAAGPGRDRSARERQAAGSGFTPAG